MKRSFRSLATAPLASGAAILVIALGTGANVAVFAIAWGVLLRPVPDPDVSELAIVSVSTSDGSDFGVPADEVGEWRQRLRTAQASAGYTTSELSLRGAGEPRLVEVALVTEGFFETLAAPALRGLLPDGSSGAEVAVVVEGVAEVGDGLLVGDRAITVAAVVPRAFDFPSDRVEVWLPELAGGPGAIGDPRKMRLVVRRDAGMAMERLADDVLRVLRELRGSQAGLEGEAYPTVTAIEDALVGELRPVLGATAAAGWLVLLVTCGNVAMLLMGRAVARRREASVRLALGAGRWQLARGPLFESLVLAAVGSALGLGLAQLGIRTFQRIAAGAIPRLESVALEMPVLAASFGLVVVVALFCGLLPALQASKSDLVTALRGGRTEEPRARRLLAALVVAQVAASVVLLAGAALLAQTVSRLLAEDVGIAGESERVRTLAVRLPLGRGGRTDPAELRTFAAVALERIRALPGVASVGLGSSLPPRGLPFQIFVRWRTPERDEGRTMSVVSATPGFLEALGARLRDGRVFEIADEVPGREVILLSESAARFYFPGQQAVGRELPGRLPPVAPFAGKPWVEGVVGDVKYAGLEQPADATIYLPWSLRPAPTSYLVVRAASGLGAFPETLAPQVRRILRELDPELPIPQIGTLEDEMATSIVERRLRVVPALGFATVALAVALMGVFALFVRSVAERRRELAIRLALGATRSSVTAMVLGRAAWLVAAGLAAGLAGTAAVAGGLRTLLWGVEPLHPPTFAAVAVGVAAAALLAAWLPARRAARVEPSELLRSE